jgi:hypothetical protein
VKRSLFGLVVSLSLFACKEEPRGKLEPIPRPPGMKDTPAPAADTPGAPARPTADPAKAVLRWKLAPGASATYRLVVERTGAAEPEAAEPEEEKSPRGKKGRGQEREQRPEPAAPAATASLPSAFTYVVERTDSGDYRLRVVPEGQGATEDQGTLSERGFVLDGLQGVTRNLATLVLELPRDAVGTGDTWSLGTELVSPDKLGPNFQQGAPPERRNRVKLTALAPADGGEQVATVEYDLYERVSGTIPPPRKPATVPAREGEEEREAPQSASGEVDISTEVKITGRGEFLVKAGRWRTWEGALSTVTKGPFPSEALQVPPGALKLRVSALEAAPAPQPTAQQPRQ